MVTPSNNSIHGDHIPLDPMLYTMEPTDKRQKSGHLHDVTHSGPSVDVGQTVTASDVTVCPVKKDISAAADLVTVDDGKSHLAPKFDTATETCKSTVKVITTILNHIEVVSSVDTFHVQGVLLTKITSESRQYSVVTGLC